MLFFVRYKKRKRSIYGAQLIIVATNMYGCHTNFKNQKKKKKQQGSRAVVFNGQPDDSSTNELSEVKDRIVTGWRVWNKFYFLFPTGTWTTGHHMYNEKTMPHIKKKESA